MSIRKVDVLEYHRMGRPGKLEIRAAKPLVSQRDFSLAYSPGVAYAVQAVDEGPLDAYEYTAKGNLVAVVSNGTALLGSGNRGHVAGKPVMEGKVLLFKQLADVDVFDIGIDASTPEEVIAATKAIAPGFGGINLEDIDAPACFEIERRLQERLFLARGPNSSMFTSSLCDGGLRLCDVHGYPATLDPVRQGHVLNRAPRRRHTARERYDQ